MEKAAEIEDKKVFESGTWNCCFSMLYFWVFGGIIYFSGVFRLPKTDDFLDVKILTALIVMEYVLTAKLIHTVIFDAKKNYYCVDYWTSNASKRASVCGR